MEATSHPPHHPHHHQNHQPDPRPRNRSPQRHVVSSTIPIHRPSGLVPASRGTWAKSTHVPKGSSVVFKATNADGQTATSHIYKW